MVDNDEELVVVWSGRDELLPDRETKPSMLWQGPQLPEKRRWHLRSVPELHLSEKRPPLEDDDGVSSSGTTAKVGIMKEGRDG